MIASFRHKGLRHFFETGSVAGIQAPCGQAAPSVCGAGQLEVGTSDLNAPGWRLHALGGDLKGCHSITVNGNWRLIFFRFAGKNVELLDSLDYH